MHSEKQPDYRYQYQTTDDTPEPTAFNLGSNRSIGPQDRTIGTCLEGSLRLEKTYRTIGICYRTFDLGRNNKDLKANG